MQYLDNSPAIYYNKNMKMTLRQAAFFITGVIIFSVLGSSKAQQTPSPVTTFANGHSVSGAFLTQYNSVTDPLRIYGLPITDEFEGVAGFDIARVQYFENARFDLVTAPDGSTSVVVANLGELTYRTDGKSPPVPNAGPGCERFGSRRYSVCRDFLAFYKRYGGENTFGLPIANLEFYNGHFVQSFEKARLIWVPDSKDPDHIRLAALGLQYFDETVNDPSLLIPGGSSPAGNPAQPHVEAYSRFGALPAGGTQEVFIYVYDVYNQPVADAKVTVTAILPDGSTAELDAGETNITGIKSFQYRNPNLEPEDIVTFDIRVQAGDQTLTASTSYQVWY